MNWLSGSCVASSSSSLSLTLLPPALCLDFNSAVTPSTSSTGWTVKSPPPALLPESHHHCLHRTITCMHCPGQGGQMTKQTDWQAKKVTTTMLSSPHHHLHALPWRRQTEGKWPSRQTGGQTKSSSLSSPHHHLPWTSQTEGKWPSRQTGGQSNHHKRFAL